MMTLIVREMFATTGTLASGSLGNFSAITGTLYQRAGGPRLSAGVAARADMHNQGFAGGQFTMADNSMPKLFTGAWFFFKSIGGSGEQQSQIVDIIDSSGSNSIMRITGKGGKIGANVMAQFWNECPINPTNQWVFFGIGASKVSGTSVDIKFYYKTLGGPLMTWSELTGFNPTWWNTSMGFVKFGAFWGADNNFCFGAPGVYTFANADFSDVVYPSDLIEPVTRLSWYVNPATGNDNNDGADAGRAWATAAKVNTESQYCGFVPALISSAGDTLIIDTSSADLDVSAEGLVLDTSGLNVRGINGTINLRSWKVIAPGNWTPVGGNVYSTSNTYAQCVVWEDDKWMNHPNGASYSAVSAALAATPGSFWTDGATLYVHPFGNTDPRSDGKVYTRSCFGSGQSAGQTGAALILKGSDMDVWDFVIKKTCDVQPGGISDGGYCISTSSGAFGGHARIKNCRMYYGGKHGLGFTNDANNSDITVENCQVEQCSPYSSQTCFVNYMAGPSAHGNICRYIRCKTLKNEGLIGSANGQNSNQQVWVCHNNGPGEQWSDFEFTDNYFPRGSIQTGMIQTFKISGGRLGGVSAYSPTNIVERVYFDGTGLQVVAADPAKGNIITNCLIVPEVPFSGGTNEGWNLQGTVTIEGCTFDLSKIPAGSPDYSILWFRVSPLNVTFVNNIVMSDGRFAITRYGYQTDILDFHNNAYNGLPNIAIYYNGSADYYSNLAQWQAFGKDANTISPADLKLDTGLKPLAGSPVIDKGSNLGSMKDYTGTVFAVRNDIGAYEFAVTVVGTAAGSGSGTYGLLYAIAQNTAGIPPGVGDGIYALASKVLKNTGGTPAVGDSLYNLFYKIAGSTAGAAPKPGDRMHSLLSKIAQNTSKAATGGFSVGDGRHKLLSKISTNTEK